MKSTMRKKRAYVTAAVLIVLVAGASLLLTAGATLDQASEQCSVLTVSYGENVFLGGNADTSTYGYRGATPYLFFFPHRVEDHGSENGYGFAVFGWEWKENTENYRIYVSGMNEKGLAFGRSGLPPVPLNPHPERPYSASSEVFEVKAMRECSSVACVIEMAKKFDWGSSSALLNQYHFADSTGDAVVISAGKEGELAFTRKEKEGYLVSTNFNRANPDNGKYPCWRYDTAVSMLQESGQGDLDYAASILDAIHVEGALINTTISYIFDLRTGDIYVYYFHQFDEVIRINLGKGLADERFSGYEHMISHGEYLPKLFSQKTREKAVSEFRGYCIRFFAAILIFSSAVGLSGLYLYRRHRRKSTRMQATHNLQAPSQMHVKKR